MKRLLLAALALYAAAALLACAAAVSWYYLRAAAARGDPFLLAVPALAWACLAGLAAALGRAACDAARGKVRSTAEHPAGRSDHAEEG